MCVIKCNPNCGAKFKNEGCFFNNETLENFAKHFVKLSRNFCQKAIFSAFLGLIRNQARVENHIRIRYEYVTYESVSM